MIVLKSAAKIRPFSELTMKKVWKNADSQKLFNTMNVRGLRDNTQKSGVEKCVEST